MALDDSSRMPKDPVTCFQCVIDSHTGRMRIVKSVLLRTLLEPLTRRYGSGVLTYIMRAVWRFVRI